MGGSAAGTRNGPVQMFKVTESLGKDFEQDELQTRLVRPKKNVLLLALYHACQPSVTLRYSRKQTRTSSLLCARHLLAMALGRTAYKRIDVL